MKIALLVLSAIWYTLLVPLSLYFAYKGAKKKEPKITFRQYFPVEIFSGDNAYGLLPSILFRIGLLGSLFPLIALRVSLPSLASSTLGSYLSFALIIGGLLLIALFGLLYVSPKNEKAHLLLYVVSASLLAMFLLSEGLSFLALRDYASKGNVATIVLSSLLFVLTAMVIPLLTHPGLKKWYQLERVALPDGSFVYERPKVFLLALFEWLLLLLLSLGFLFSEILLFLLVL